jgi:hypothetical protein
MVKLRKEDTADLDIDELDALEYSTETFDSYDGEVPPKDIELSGYVKKMWWTRTQNNDPMLKILWVADENTDDYEEFNGCPFWLNYALIGGAKFRWAPFMENYGFTLRQVKNNTEVEDKDDQNGAPIVKVGSFRPGQENDEAWSRVVTDRERYNGEWKPAIKEWLPFDDDEDEPVDDVEEDEPEDEEEEPEPEPEPARTRGRQPARAARTATEKTPARGARTATRSASKEPEKPAPARGTRGARTAATTKSAAPARGRGRARGSSDDPPF